MKQYGSYLLTDYNNREAKKYIQNRIIEQNMNMNLDIFGPVLMGPTPESYLSYFFQYNVIKKDARIISNENNKKNYLTQLENIEKLSYRRNIIANFSDISSSTFVSRYVDLDFCGVLEAKNYEIATIITNLFNQQQSRYNDVSKVLNFTVSAHFFNKGKNYIKSYISDVICKFLIELLKCEVIVKGNSELSFGSLYYTHIASMKYEVQIYYYYDKTPMLNIYIKSFF
jgi:hypothetical protein